ncbi:MAG: pyridine nucleotide-disulfide oxidoreductase [Desulfuromonas sp.]|nr:MAG: pyridine nucleotide-disulfide oxidoreductase [Desulfuromonas sp.]
MATLVLAGAGHAHLPILTNIPEFVRRGHCVTVIGADDFHYYSGMGPGLLSGDYRPEHTRFDVATLTRRGGGTFVRDRVTGIDPGTRKVHTENSGWIDYDVLSCNLGSSVCLPTGEFDKDRVFTVKPIENLDKFRRSVQATDRNLLVVGGGAAGAEIAANLGCWLSGSGHSAHVDLIAGNVFLADFPAGIRHRVERTLDALPVRLHAGERLAKLERGQAILESGLALPYDRALLATGVTPPLLFAEADLPTGQDGGLLVNRFLQAIDHPEIFGGGDCISFADRHLARVGVYAVRQGPVLLRNLLAALEGEQLTPFRPQNHFLLIFNLGRQQGLLRWHSLTWSGRIPFLIKDYIDRRFMQEYQRCGETNQPHSSS